MVIPLHISDLTSEELEELKKNHTIVIFGDSILVFL